MEPRKPVLSPTPGRTYPTAVKTARVPTVTPIRPDGAVSRSSAASNAVVLPMINPPSSSGISSSSARTNSPSTIGGKRTGWTTPRHPSDMAPAPPASRPPGRNARILDNSGEFQESSSPSSVGNISFWNEGVPAATSSSTGDADQDEVGQLAYIDSMYSRIQQLNTELDREQEVRAHNIEDHVEQRERAVLEAVQRYGAHNVEESDNFGTVGAQVPLQSAHDTNAVTMNRKFRPHQPRSTSPPQPTAMLPKDQLELCTALGKNAELRIRAREIERQAEEASTVIEQSQRQMKMAERRIANREEKLRALLKEKLHWQNEMKDLREQVVEEKMRQVDLMRRLETNKRETTAQVDHMAQSLRDTEEDNQALRAYLIETKSHLAIQTKRFEDFVKQARDEREKLTECIMEARGKFREWREGEASALKAQRDQALNHLRAEYELKIARHQDEKQKLRDKVKDLEVSVRLMQKDRSLSPLELSLRKATILGSKDHAGTTEAELIEAHVRIKELEALLEHSQDFQTRQENIIKVSEATISRLIQEREVAALDTLANQQVAGSQAWVNSALNADLSPLSLSTFSSAGPASAMSLSPGRLTSPSRPGYSSASVRGLSQSPSHRVDPSPPPGRPKMPDQPVRPVAPSPRPHAVLSPSRQNSRERLTKNEDCLLSKVQDQVNSSTTCKEMKEVTAVANERATNVQADDAEDRTGTKLASESRNAEHKATDNHTVMQCEQTKYVSVDETAEQRGSSSVSTRDNLRTAVPSDASGEDCNYKGDLVRSSSLEGTCEETLNSSYEQGTDKVPSEINGSSRQVEIADGVKEAAFIEEVDTTQASNFPNEEPEQVVDRLQSSSSDVDTEPADEPNEVSPDHASCHRGHTVESDIQPTATEQSTQNGGKTHSGEQLDASNVLPNDCVVDERVNPATEISFLSEDIAAEQKSTLGSFRDCGDEATRPEILCEEKHSADVNAVVDVWSVLPQEAAEGVIGDVIPPVPCRTEDCANGECDEVGAEDDGVGECEIGYSERAYEAAAFLDIEADESEASECSVEAHQEKDTVGDHIDAENRGSHQEDLAVRKASRDEKPALFQDEGERRLDEDDSSVGIADPTESLSSASDLPVLSGGWRNKCVDTEAEEFPIATTETRCELSSSSEEATGSACTLVEGVVSAALSETIDSIIVADNLHPLLIAFNTSDLHIAAVDGNSTDADADEGSALHSGLVDNPECDCNAPGDGYLPTFDQAVLVREVSKTLIASVEHDAKANDLAGLLSVSASTTDEVATVDAETATSDAGGDAMKETINCVVAHLVDEVEREAIFKVDVDECGDSLESLCAIAAKGAEECQDTSEASILQSESVLEVAVDSQLEAHDPNASLASEISNVVADAKEDTNDSEIVATERGRVLPPVDQTRSNAEEREESRAGGVPSPAASEGTEDCVVRVPENAVHREAVAQLMATSLVVAASAQVVGTMAATSTLQGKSPTTSAQSDTSIAICGPSDAAELIGGGEDVETDATNHPKKNEASDIDASILISTSLDAHTGDDFELQEIVLVPANDGVQSGDQTANEEDHPVCNGEVDGVAARPFGDGKRTSNDEDRQTAMDLSEEDATVPADPPSASRGEPHVEQVSADGEIAEEVVNDSREEAFSCGVADAELPRQSTEDTSAIVDRTVFADDAVVSFPALISEAEDRLMQADEDKGGSATSEHSHKMVAIAFVSEVEDASIGRVLASLKNQQNRDDEKDELDNRQVIHAFAEHAVNQTCEDCVVTATSSSAAARASTPSEPNEWLEGEREQREAEVELRDDKTRGQKPSEESGVTSEAECGSIEEPEADSALAPTVTSTVSPTRVEPVESHYLAASIEASPNEDSSIEHVHRDYRDVAELEEDTVSICENESARLTGDESPLVVAASEPDNGELLDREEPRMISEASPKRDGGVADIVSEEVSEVAIPATETREAVESIQPSDESAPCIEEQPSASEAVAIDTLSPSLSTSHLDAAAIRGCIDDMTARVEADATVPLCWDRCQDPVIESAQGAQSSDEGGVKAAPAVAEGAGSGTPRYDADASETPSFDAEPRSQPGQSSENVASEPQPDLQIFDRLQSDEDPQSAQLSQVSLPDTHTDEMECETQESDKTPPPDKPCESAAEAPSPEQAWEAAVSDTHTDLQFCETDATETVPRSDASAASFESTHVEETEKPADTSGSQQDANHIPNAPVQINGSNPVEQAAAETSEQEQLTGLTAGPAPMMNNSEAVEGTAVAPVEAPCAAENDQASHGDSEPMAIRPADRAVPAAGSDERLASTTASAPVRQHVPLVMAAVEGCSTSIVWTPSKTDTWQDLVGGNTFNPLEMSIGRTTSPVTRSAHPDTSRYQSAIVREQIRDPTLMAYGLKQEQATPFAMLDDKILTIDQNARHMQYDENDKVRRVVSASQVTNGRVAAIEGVLVTKRKKMENEAHRKSIAYRIIPAFNYEPVLIKFQWSDFVVATPIRLMSSVSQINLLTSLNGGSDPVKPVDLSSDKTNKVTKPQIMTSPIQKMKLILKKGVKLPCGTYVIISVFNRPLEDGNENLRIQIYDAENVEEFQYDFHEDHLREYVEEWKGADAEAIAFYERLEFRREQGSIIIKMPEKIRQTPMSTPDTDAESGDTLARVFTPPPMAQLLTNLATTQPLELPPEPQYRLSPNAPASPPRLPPPFLHQATAPDRLESMSFISKIDEDTESMASSIARR